MGLSMLSCPDIGRAHYMRTRTKLQRLPSVKEDACPHYVRRRCKVVSWGLLN